MKRSKKRSGFSLVEMLVVISISFPLLALNVIWIQQTFKFSSNITQRQRHHQALTRLAADLRGDARHCNSFSLENENSLILNQAEEKLTRFTIEGNTIRVEKITGSDTIAREAYHLSTGSMIRWDSSEMPQSVSLTVLRSRLGNSSISRKQPSDANNVLEPPAVDLFIRVQPQRYQTGDIKFVDRTKTEEQPK